MGQGKTSSAFSIDGAGGTTGGFPSYPEVRPCPELPGMSPLILIAEEYNHTFKANLWHEWGTTWGTKLGKKGYPGDWSLCQVVDKEQVLLQIR